MRLELFYNSQLGRWQVLVDGNRARVLYSASTSNEAQDLAVEFQESFGQCRKSCHGPFEHRDFCIDGKESQ